VTRPRLTVRARLTLLYAGLFAVCGAIVVAVSYALVARQGTAKPGPGPSPPGGITASFAKQFLSGQLGDVRDKRLTGKCQQYLQYLHVQHVQHQAALNQLQGEQHQIALTLSHLLRYSLITLAVVIALAAVLGWIFSGRALRPVQQITAAARAASERNLSARVAPSGPRDELRELAETFDAMLGRLQAAFEGQQRFIANASHELRTPLAVMRTTADVVLDDPDATPADLRGMATDIRAVTGHAEHLIGALLMLARNERGLTVREQTDLAAVAEDVLDTAALGDWQVHASLDPAVITGDPVLAERLITNLVDNAAKYNHPGGDIWITTCTVAGSSELTVANTGPVISTADISRIFQPFERLNGRSTGEGFGLGLAIVASIAAIHGGAATARPRDDGGLSVTVTIPSAGVPSQDTGIQATEHEILTVLQLEPGRGVTVTLLEAPRRGQLRHVRPSARPLRSRRTCRPATKVA
jgi:signal transduction histidine kinase